MPAANLEMPKTLDGAQSLRPSTPALARNHRGQLILPADGNAMLSDEFVYAALKKLTPKERPADQGVWDGNGEILFPWLTFCLGLEALVRADLPPNSSLVRLPEHA